MISRFVVRVGVAVLLISGMLWAAPQKQLTVEDIYQNLRFSRQLPLRLEWLPGGKQLSFIKFDQENGDQQLWILDIRSNQERMILTNKALTFTDSQGDTQNVSFMHYQWNSAETGLLLPDDGDLFFYSFTSEKLTRLTNSPEDEEDIGLSPDGQWASFVRDNNLFVVNIASGEEKQLTSDGKENVMNGKKDWVYQEELGSRGDFKGYWWSPNSRSIAYYQMDDRPVPVYPIVDFRPLHPTVDYTRYPYPGDPNPIVKVGVVNVASAENLWLDLGADTSDYFPRVFWLRDSRQVAVMRLNRLQQKLEFLFADAETGTSHVVLTETNPYWLNIDDDVYFLKKKDRFIWGSARSGFRQLYLYDYQGNMVRQLTSGDWTVTGFEGVDENRGWVYYVSTEKDLLERQLYRVNMDGRKKTQVTSASGVHRITLAPGGRYYLDEFSSPLTPARITVHAADGKLLRETGEDDSAKLAEYNLVKPEFFTINGDSGLVFHAMMIKPPDFNPAKKYPVLVDVYGGPHSQTVIKGFTDLWQQLMAQKGYIVFSMDNRGTANRGRKWETPIYRHLGKIELKDQLTGVAYLKSLPYVDPGRIGIWGWSYGGYMVLYAMTHSGVFRAGTAVAPVVDWHYYDSIYTERYMSLPSLNEAGYLSSSALESVDSLRGDLFLAHGLSDDNVHLQNSVKFIDGLIQDDTQFRLMVYPHQEHSIRSTADRIDLFNAITDFFLENL